MTDLKTFLARLHQNLNLLQEREAKYGGNAPLDLLNQIADHKQAIALTEQTLKGDLSEGEWLTELQPLLISRSDWLGVNLAVQLILEQYVGDQGGALAQIAGPQAAAKAGEITSFVLKQVKDVDPRTAQRYPEDPTGYQVPLNDVLNEILEANAGLVDQLKTLLEQYQTILAESRPGQSSELRANLSGSGVITQQSTQRAGKRGVVGANADGNIITGDGNVVGDVSASGSTGVTVGGTGHRISATQGISGEELAQIFVTLHQQVEANPSLTPETKADVNAELKDLQAETTAAEQGDTDDESFIRRRLRNLENMAPDIIDTIAATLANPVAGLTGVWAKIVAKAREIKAARQTS